MGNDMADARSEVSVRRATVVGLQAAEELVASYRQRVATTVLGSWEEHLPVCEAGDESAVSVLPASSSAGGHGRQKLRAPSVGHAPLHGAA